MGLMGLNIKGLNILAHINVTKNTYKKMKLIAIFEKTEITKFSSNHLTKDEREV